MKVGIVGTGYICEFHIAALRTIPWVELVAVCDTVAERAQRVARNHGIAKVYTSAAEMIRECGIDVAHVLTPPHLHRQTAIECLEAGARVFLEKPAALDSSETVALREAALKTGQAIGVNHNAVFNPAFQRVVAAVRKWRLGRVQHVTCCVNVPLRQIDTGQHGHWMFQRFGNIILEQAPHPLSQIHFLLGDIHEASVLLSPPVALNTGVPFHDTWQIAMRCERGTAQCLLSFGREHLDNWIHVIGQDGSAFADLRRGATFFTRKTRFMPPIDDLLNTGGAGWSLAVQAARVFSDYVLGFLKLRPAGDLFSQGMRGSIGGFYQALRAGEALPVSIEQGAAVIRACETIIRVGASHA